MKKKHRAVSTLAKVLLAVGGILALLICTLFFVIWAIFKHPSPEHAAVKIDHDVIFGRIADVDLKLDYFYPTNQDRPNSVVMYVHGGAWRAGSKSMLSIIPGPAELLERGYAVVAINYRLGPDHKFPAMLEDSKCAVRFLRAHAKEFNLDPERIGVIGDSSGGHLVSLLGLTDSSAGFEGQGGWSNQSSGVQAVVDLYGPSDFATAGADNSKIARAVLKSGFGVEDPADPALKRASPVTYVSAKAPPFLIIHGDHDDLVPLTQSEELHEKLKAAGADSTLIVVTNFSHGFTPIGLKSSPTSAELAKIITDFFDKHLRSSPR
jgi:acetyl esterase/lipase